MNSSEGSSFCADRNELLQQPVDQVYHANIHKWRLSHNCTELRQAGLPCAPDIQHRSPGLWPHRTKRYCHYLLGELNSVAVNYTGCGPTRAVSSTAFWGQCGAGTSSTSCRRCTLGSCAMIGRMGTPLTCSNLRLHPSVLEDELWAVASVCSCMSRRPDDGTARLKNSARMLATIPSLAASVDGIAWVCELYRASKGGARAVSQAPVTGCNHLPLAPCKAPTAETMCSSGAGGVLELHHSFDDAVRLSQWCCNVSCSGNRYGRSAPGQG